MVKLALAVQLLFLEVCDGQGGLYEHGSDKGAGHGDARGLLWKWTAYQ